MLNSKRINKKINPKIKISKLIYNNKNPKLNYKIAFRNPIPELYLPHTRMLKGIKFISNYY